MANYLQNAGKARRTAMSIATPRMNKFPNLRLCRNETVENHRGQTGYPGGGASGRGFDSNEMAFHASGAAMRTSMSAGERKRVKKIEYKVTI
jgi:hypothetical protein